MTDVIISNTLLKLLVCIATSNRGWSSSQYKFIEQLERDLFDE